MKYLELSQLMLTKSYSCETYDGEILDLTLVRYGLFTNGKQEYPLEDIRYVLWESVISFKQFVGIFTTTRNVSYFIENGRKYLYESQSDMFMRLLNKYHYKMATQISYSAFAPSWDSKARLIKAFKFAKYNWNNPIYFDVTAHIYAKPNMDWDKKLYPRGRSD